MRPGTSKNAVEELKARWHLGFGVNFSSRLTDTNYRRIASIASVYCSIMANKTVLISGGNRGLGLSLVETFSKAGWNVLATARNVASLPLNIKNVKGYALDLSKHEDIVGLADSLVSSGDVTSLDLVIHNAGFNPKDQKHVQGYFDSTFYAANFSAANVNESMMINALHPMELTGRLFPILSDDAIVIAISSWLGSIGNKVRKHRT